MRLLSSRTARFHEFNDSSELPHYAILSHVWQPHGEQSYSDVIACMGADDPRALVSEKISQFCIFAEKEGFQWVWVDTCCIDKSSSAELSEAINSMYAWYAAAQVCYVFMHDVEDTHPSRDGSFRRSVWFTRGWTLQELIAPAHVVFLSKEWHTLGTKQTLAHLIQDVTSINVGVLLGTVHLSQVSVARRLSWAALRQTTREEDRAYSLMGIFNVHMPTIYGEGSQAFERLQLEILKRCPDQSIFAWGIPFVSYDLLQLYASRPLDHDQVREPRVLLASSPADFAHSGDITPIHLTRFNDELGLLRKELGTEGMPPPEYMSTSHGMRITFPTIHGTAGDQKAGTIVTCAILACQDARDNIIILFLSQSRSTDYYFYHIGADMVALDHGLSSTSQYYRIGVLPRHCLTRQLKRNIYLRNTYLAYSRSSAIVSNPIRHHELPSTRHNTSKYAFFFPTWVFNYNGLTAVPDVSPSTPSLPASSDGLMLEVFPGSPRRTIIFARTSHPHREPRNESAFLPEGFRLNITLDCSCENDPLQHPVSLAVDVINPGYQGSTPPRLVRHVSSGSLRSSRSLSSLLLREQFVQMMLQTSPSPAGTDQNPTPTSIISIRDPTHSPTFDTQETAWQCQNGRTHLPTISNPYLLLKFTNILGRVEITLKRWQNCHRTDAFYVYVVDVNLASTVHSLEPERKTSLPSYTEGVVPSTGLILYNPETDVRSPSPNLSSRPSQNANRAVKPSPSSRQSDRPTIVRDATEATNQSGRPRIGIASETSLTELASESDELLRVSDGTTNEHGTTSLLGLDIVHRKLTFWSIGIPNTNHAFWV